MSLRKDKIWEEFKSIEATLGQRAGRVECLHCGKEFACTGSTRLKAHIIGGVGVAKCTAVPSSVIDKHRATTPSSTASTQPSISALFGSSAIVEADASVTDFFIEEGISLKKVESGAFNVEVMAGLTTMLEKMLPPEGVTKALADYSTKFRRFLGSFSGDGPRERASQMPGHVWWDLHGSSAPELQSVAVKVLSQSPSSSPTERSWSDYDYIKNKRRNRLLPATAEKLVYVYRNSRETACFDTDFDELYVPWNLSDPVEEL